MIEGFITYEIERLLVFGLENKLIEKDDIITTRNAMMDLLCVPEPLTENLLKKSQTR